ncbi:uncharacterized protein [Rutidosis leptorrhynchoides]|uniref:uncharacterized protein n=1 Tax=Rutidosis leptorrhynchoides TaxID=125765 RepID=UPI003A99284D
MAFKFIAEAPDASIYKKIPNAFLCLRNLELSEVDFRCDNFLSFVVEMICGSPNMQTLMIKATRKDNLIAYARSSLDFDHNKIGQLQLQNVYIDNYRGLTNENHLIKYILACSPLLKKIVIKPFDDNGKNNSQMFWFAEKLLTFPRVSRVAKIYLHGYLDY